MMRAMLLTLLLAALLVSASAEAKKKELVGGPCTYEEFGGTCTDAGKDAAGKGLFTFSGTVGGREVSLEGNTMMPGMSMRRGSMACKLEFIKQGTCTPCVFSIGECGPPAWDLFRASGKKRR